MLLLATSCHRVLLVALDVDERGSAPKWRQSRRLFVGANNASSSSHPKGNPSSPFFSESRAACGDTGRHKS